MEDEQLIECVRKYEFLYNLQHPKYMDTVKKEIAWKEIAKQLQQPAASCKQKWQRLRDSYRRALNKRKTKSGHAATKIKKWKYEDEMSFIIPFFVEKKTLESAELSSDKEEFEKKDEVTEVQNPTDSENNSNTDVDVAAFHDTEIWDESDTTVSIKSSQLQGKKAKARKRAKVLPMQSASAVLMSRLLDEQSIFSGQREHDELDRFFLTISETVKKFSPYLQAVAKNKIFSLVSEIELQQLAPPSFSTSTAQYGNTPSFKRSDTPIFMSPETSDVHWNNAVEREKSENSE